MGICRVVRRLHRPHRSKYSNSSYLIGHKHDNRRFTLPPPVISWRVNSWPARIASAHITVHSSSNSNMIRIPVSPIQTGHASWITHSTVQPRHLLRGPSQDYWQRTIRWSRIINTSIRPRSSTTSRIQRLDKAGVVLWMRHRIMATMGPSQPATRRPQWPPPFTSTTNVPM